MILPDANRWIYRVTPGNFGDDLNEWLNQRYLNLEPTARLYSGQEANDAFSGTDTVFLMIGTILNRRIPEKGYKVVLGSGAGYGKLPDTAPGLWQFEFVRGPKTADALSLPRKKAITDPAILLGQEYRRSSNPELGLAYMPHHATANSEWQHLCEDLGLTYIDPRQPYHLLLPQLRKVELLITEAMHGAIVADTLRIPWLPVKTAKKINQFKWEDWCASMDMTYSPTPLPSLWLAPTAHKPFKYPYLALKKLEARRRLRKLLARGIPQLSLQSIYDTRLNQVDEKYRQLTNTGL